MTAYRVRLVVPEGSRTERVRLFIVCARTPEEAARKVGPYADARVLAEELGTDPVLIANFTQPRQREARS
jgi:hypothetical protein